MYEKINDEDYVNGLMGEGLGKNKACIANYSGEWFRAYVESDTIDEKGLIKVFFVDYGTTDSGNSFLFFYS